MSEYGEPWMVDEDHEGKPRIISVMDACYLDADKMDRACECANAMAGIEKPERVRALLEGLRVTDGPIADYWLRGELREIFGDG